MTFLARFLFPILLFAAPAVGQDALLQKMAEDANISEVQARIALESAFETIVTELEGGRVVAIAGFGRFSVRESAPRKGRNPRTGEPLFIEARRYPRFSAAEKLKLRLRLGPPQLTNPADIQSPLAKELREYLRKRLP